MAIEEVVTSDRAAARTRPLAALCACTRGRPRMAERCFQSLRSQAADALAMRIIVVDNDPAGGAREAFDEVFGADPRARYVLCSEPGIPFARNAALDAALEERADYIAFIDDDEVAPPGWLAALFGLLDSSRADVVQGGVRRVLGAEETAIEAAAPLDAAENSKPVETAATCNVLFKTRLIQPPLALRFDEGMRYTGGSDRDFFMRAHQNGAVIVKTEGAYVVEEVCGGRETFGYECARAFAAGANYTRRMIKNETPPTAARRIGFRILDRALVGVFKLAVGALWLLLLQYARAARQVRKGGAHVSFAAGSLSALVGVRAQPYRILQGA